MRLAVSCFYLCRFIGSCADLEPHGLNLAGRHLAGRRIRGSRTDRNTNRILQAPAESSRCSKIFETSRDGKRKSTDALQHSNQTILPAPDQMPLLSAWA